MNAIPSPRRSPCAHPRELARKRRATTHTGERRRARRLPAATPGRDCWRRRRRSSPNAIAVVPFTRYARDVQSTQISVTASPPHRLHGDQPDSQPPAAPTLQRGARLTRASRQPPLMYYRRPAQRARELAKYHPRPPPSNEPANGPLHVHHLEGGEPRAPMDAEGVRIKYSHRDRMEHAPPTDTTSESEAIALRLASNGHHSAQPLQPSSSTQKANLHLCRLRPARVETHHPLSHNPHVTPPRGGARLRRLGAQPALTKTSSEAKLDYPSRVGLSGSTVWSPGGAQRSADKAARSFVQQRAHPN